VRRDILSWTHFLPQHKWISDGEGNILVDFVAKLENLEIDFHKIKERTKINDNLEIINKSEKKGYKNYYSEETAKIVQRVYKKDVKYLGYSY